MLELNRITAGYGDITVLREVSMWVPRAGSVAVTGGPGAGKTSLLRVAAGLVKPGSGEMVLDGRECTGWSPHLLARHGVCHIAAGRDVYPRLTVLQNIYVEAAGGDVEGAVASAMAVFPDLGRVLRRMAGRLPVGQQRMLSVCRAWINAPRYVLLDDVLSGLGSRESDAIIAALEALVVRGCGLLMTTGDENSRLVELADIVHVLDRGHAQVVRAHRDDDSAGLAFNGAGHSPVASVSSAGAGR